MTSIRNLILLLRQPWIVRVAKSEVSMESINGI